MPNTNTYSVLIIEPNDSLVKPYDLFSDYPAKYSFSISRFTNISDAISHLRKEAPNLICLSSRLPTKDMVSVLEAAHMASRTSIIPLLFAIDFSQPIIHLPGTTWANQLGVIHAQTSSTEFRAILSRLL